MTYKKDDLNNMGSKDYRALIKKQAFYLAELLAESPEYIQFVAARKRLEADDVQHDMLSQLRQQQVVERLSLMMGEETFNDTDQTEEVYLTMAGNPLLSDYLFAEGRLLSLISSIEEVFSDKLELWHLPEDFMMGDYDTAVLN